MKIYLATSWKNQYYTDLLKELRDAGHEVYDFRHEGFSWDKIDSNWRNWTPQQYVDHLDLSEDVEDGFQRDLNAIHWCNLLIMLMPCGLSAGLELGYAAALGKMTAVLVMPEFSADLMIKVAGCIFDNKEDLMNWLGRENKWFE